MRNALIAALAATSFFIFGASAAAQEKAPVIEDGSTVTIEYTLKLADGSTLDTNVGGEPLVYVQGDQQIMPALEEQLLGMKADETRSVSLTPEQGYGPVQEEYITEVPLEAIPEEARHEGAQLVGQGPHGEPIPAVVKQINAETAVVDLNHPLAGETLHFDIKVISIE